LASSQAATSNRPVPMATSFTDFERFMASKSLIVVCAIYIVCDIYIAPSAVNFSDCGNIRAGNARIA
jgi:hypothetical protein